MQEQVINNSEITTLEFDEQDYCEITNRILVVSPRPAALRTLVAELAQRCYDVLLLHHADDPLLSMVNGNIIVVDRTVNFPATVTSAWPSDGTAPVLALVNDLESAVVQGEELIQWPGQIDEVIEKIQQLSLKSMSVGNVRSYVFKDLALDLDRMTITRSGTRIDLTKTEYDILRTLISSGGKVLTRQELMSEVWGEQYFGGSNAIDVHIRSLRSKLGDDPKVPSYIATVRGAGYRLAD